MASFKKAISSVVAACAVCGVLATCAFASATGTNAVASTDAVNSVSYDFSEVYQEYMGFFTDPTLRYASSKDFDTTVSVFRGPNYPANVAVYQYASDAGAYSYTATVNGTGTYSANYYYYSTGSTESRDVVLGIGFDTRETPGARFKITGVFYPNGL